MTRDDRPPLPDHVGILVVGAGMAGLTAARALADAGRDVLVVDKGWNPGGRLATRVTDRARFDHGATFFYAPDGDFQADLERWRSAAAAEAWEGLSSGETLWRGAPDMRGLGTQLARGLRVATRTPLEAVGAEGGRWTARLADGGAITADAVLMTPPVPQSLELLRAGDHRLEAGLEKRLARIAYERCLVVMAEPGGPARVPAPGFLEPASGPIARVVDEQAKGASTVPAVTLHAASDFSRARWEADRDRVAAEILRAAERWLGDDITGHQIHGWRYSRSVTTWPEPCLVVPGGPPLVLAGDAFGGPDVPGAHRSGRAAAAVLGVRLDS
jgi:predicted NAD/FAD-dependent oxidoreductase